MAAAAAGIMQPDASGGSIAAPPTYYLLVGMKDAWTAASCGGQAGVRRPRRESARSGGAGIHGATGGMGLIDRQCGHVTAGACVTADAASDASSGGVVPRAGSWPACCLNGRRSRRLPRLAPRSLVAGRRHHLL